MISFVIMFIILCILSHDDGAERDDDNEMRYNFSPKHEILRKTSQHQMMKFSGDEVGRFSYENEILPHLHTWFQVFLTLIRLLSVLTERCVICKMWNTYIFISRASSHHDIGHRSDTQAMEMSSPKVRGWFFYQTFIDQFTFISNISFLSGEREKCAYEVGTTCF